MVLADQLTWCKPGLMVAQDIQHMQGRALTGQQAHLSLQHVSPAQADLESMQSVFSPFRVKQEQLCGGRPRHQEFVVTNAKLLPTLDHRSAPGAAGGNKHV